MNMQKSSTVNPSAAESSPPPGTAPCAQPEKLATGESTDRLAWFRRAKYGMFVHWGLYSLLGRSEWDFYRMFYTVGEYEALAKQFTAERYDPADWARTARQAGARYIVLTTRHHDGFCLFDSQVSDFTAPKTAARRDLIAEYVEALRAEGIRIGLYYSPVDWRYRGAWDHRKYPESAASMVDQAFAQVTELLTRYGKIDLIWFDGTRCMDAFWENETDSAYQARFWRAQEMHDLIFRLQPDIVINNRYVLPGDYATPEQKITPSKEGALWESCLTMDLASWCYNPYHPTSKTTAKICAEMVDVARGGGNLLFNTGPCADGTLRPIDQCRLLEAGDWRRRNIDAFDHATRSPLAEDTTRFPCNRNALWIGDARDDATQYLFTVFWTGRRFAVSRIDGSIKCITRLDTGEAVAFHQEGYGRLILVDLPAMMPDPLGVIYKLQFAKPPRLLELPREQMALLIDSKL
jgi:alpha-L-fucosidase